MSDIRDDLYYTELPFWVHPLFDRFHVTKIELELQKYLQFVSEFCWHLDGDVYDATPGDEVFYYYWDGSMVHRGFVKVVEVYPNDGFLSVTNAYGINFLIPEEYAFHYKWDI